jgi:hypothetical protein
MAIELSSAAHLPERSKRCVDLIKVREESIQT